MKLPYATAETLGPKLDAALIAAALETAAERDQLKAANDELVKALAPFAACAEFIDKTLPGREDNMGLWVPSTNIPGEIRPGIWVRDVRGARAALAQAKDTGT